MKPLIITSLLLATCINAASVYAADTSAIHQTDAEKAKFQVMLHHVNPMPNYMSTLMANAKDLEISSEQMVELKKWVADNNKRIEAMVKRVVEIETSMATSSINGDDKEMLMKEFSKMADLRLEIATSKIACRDNVQSILSTHQWDKLAILQQAVMEP